ncbi:NADPH-dependent F420 reductase [soil metagenome]
MKIAIIGSGNIGGTLAQQLIKANHTVLMGVKLPLSDKSIILATKIGEDRFTSVERATAQAEVIIITTPPEAIINIIPQLGDVNDKVIIDSTNSVKTKPEPYKTAFHAIKEITKAAHVVKCFNSTGFENMANPVYHGEGIDMFCAGNSEQAKKVAEQLSKDIGFANCYNFGGDDKVELLEQFALCWINLAIMQGHGRGTAFKILKR